MSDESNETLLAEGECPALNCIKSAGHSGPHSADYTPIPKYDEALRLLERLGSVRANHEWHVRCLNAGYYGQETRPCVCADLRAFLANVDTPPQVAAREAVLRRAGESLARSQDWILAGFPDTEDYKRADEAIKEWIKVAADTSPAAAALLAQGEEMRELLQRAEKVIGLELEPAPAHMQPDGQIKGAALEVVDWLKSARAALAPGEETAT